MEREKGRGGVKENRGWLKGEHEGERTTARDSKRD